jgi:pantoate--beta-alanine ligase
MVIQKLIRLMGKEHEHEVVICPTVRAANGLAMSSRNLRLSEEERETASCIYKALLFLKENVSRSHKEMTAIAMQNLEANGFIVDYIAIADAVTLEPARESSLKLIGMIAATINSVRLIDNMQLN